MQSSQTRVLSEEEVVIAETAESRKACHVFRCSFHGDGRRHALLSTRTFNRETRQGSVPLEDYAFRLYASRVRKDDENTVWRLSTTSVAAARFLGAAGRPATPYRSTVSHCRGI